MPRYPRVLFFHIPKTGGTTVRHLMRTATRGTVVDADFVPVRYLINRHAPACSFQGHLTFFPGDFALLRDRYLTTTVLRDPTLRLISQYFQYRRADEVEKSPQSDAAKSLSLLGYLGWIGENNSFEDLNMACYWLSTLMSPGDRAIEGESALELAIEALRQMDVIGKTEELSAYAAAIGERFDLTETQAPQMNKSTTMELCEVSPAAIALARELTQFDHRLYREIFGNTSFNVLVRYRPEKDFSYPIPFQSLDFGSRSITIRDAAAGRASEAGLKSNLDCGDTLTIRFQLDSAEDTPSFTVGFGIRNINGDLIFGTNSAHLGAKLALLAGEQRTIEFQLPCQLPLGEYEVTVSVHYGESHREGCAHWLEPAVKFRVVGSRLPGFSGFVMLPTQVWSLPPLLDHGQTETR